MLTHIDCYTCVLQFKKSSTSDLVFYHTSPQTPTPPYWLSNERTNCPSISPRSFCLTTALIHFSAKSNYLALTRDSESHALPTEPAGLTVPHENQITPLPHKYGKNVNKNIITTADSKNTDQQSTQGPSLQII